MIRVSVFNAHRKYRRKVAETRSLALRVLKNEQCKNGELNIVYINDKAMVALNGEYLRHWYVTDVLSFPLADNSMGYIDGEVYVNIDQAKRQSEEYRVSLKNELERLVVHGILHLIGYNDNTVAQRKQMTRRENVYVTLSR